MPQLTLDNQPLFPIVDLSKENASYLCVHMRVAPSGRDLLRETMTPESNRILHNELSVAATTLAGFSDTKSTPETWSAWLSGVNDFSYIRRMVGRGEPSVSDGVLAVQSLFEPFGSIDHLSAASRFHKLLPNTYDVILDTSPSEMTIDEIHHRIRGAYLGYLLSLGPSDISSS